MTIIFFVLYEATPRHCCGSEYESNYISPYLIWACNHLTNQSALTSLKNTKGQIHPLVLGGICNQRLRCQEPGASPGSLLCPFCCRQFQLETDHTNVAHQLKQAHPSLIWLLKNSKSQHRMGDELGSTLMLRLLARYLSSLLSGTLPLQGTSQWGGVFLPTAQELPWSRTEKHFSYRRSWGKNLPYGWTRHEVKLTKMWNGAGEERWLKLPV